MARTNSTATARLLNFLKSGKDITVAQAQSRFGISNVSARISEIRRAGYAVYLNEKTTPKGYTIKAYRLGTPSRKMIALANLVMGDPSMAPLVTEATLIRARNLRKI